MPILAKTFERSQCAGRCRRASAHTNSALSKSQMTTNADLPSIVVSVWGVDLCAFIPEDLERQGSRWRAVGAERRYRHDSNISMYVMLASTCASAALAPMADCCPLNADVARSCRFSCPERPMRPANELFSARGSAMAAAPVTAAVAAAACQGRPAPTMAAAARRCCRRRPTGSSSVPPRLARQRCPLAG